MAKKQKMIALIAHDGKKHEMVNWALQHKDALKEYKLCGTGTTARLIAEATGLDVKGYLSGPLGGDLQIGAKMAEKAIDMVVFFLGSAFGAAARSRREGIAPYCGGV